MKREFDHLIDVWETEMQQEQGCFFRQWDRQIRRHLDVGDDFRMERYADVFGGYWLAPEEYRAMDPVLRRFYEGAVSRRGRVYLRGYDYYQADPMLHMQTEHRSLEQAWQVFRCKWKRYEAVDSFAYVKQWMSLPDWLGTLGLLEYIFSDLTSVRWFLFRNPQQLHQAFHGEEVAVTAQVDTFSDMVAEIIACMLRFELERAGQLLVRRYPAMVRSPLMRRLLWTDFDVVERASVRAMREGDSMVLIYAAYLRKLKPYCQRQRWKKIRLMSNAFGAMNVGVILKHLIAPDCQATHSNLLYAQHRSDGDSVYGDPMVCQFRFIDSPDPKKNDDADAVIVIDDSVCFGKSYQYIRQAVAYEPTYLLPLTLNCNGMRYFRVGIGPEDDLESIVRQSVRWAREMNDVLPPFFSFWDFRLTMPRDRPVGDETYCFAMLGSDLLLKHLWHVYLDEIVPYGT